MKPYDPTAFALSVNRRTFLQKSAYGLGALAFAGLLDPKLFGSAQAATTSAEQWKGVIKSPLPP